MPIENTSHRCKAATIILLFACFVQPATSVAQRNEKLTSFEDSFANPPDDCRIMMRWWWFGPAVTKSELQRELEQMKAEGIGGVEIATLYPLALDDPITGLHNQSFLSDEHLDAIRFAAAAARKLGLRVDITLGSGWPFGGPHIPVTQAAGELRVETIPVMPGVDSIAVPDIASGEQLIAAFLAPVRNGQLSLQDAKQVSTIVDGHLQIPMPVDVANNAIFFISSRTGMTVKRPAIGAEGFVLDHYDRSAIESHLHAVGDRLLDAFDGQPPYAVFSDSLEDYGSNWTSDLMEQFRTRRGYDLTPYLPALVGDIGPLTAAIRHDWGKTLTEWANERYLAPLHDWAQQHHSLFRSQTYGFPPVTLSSNRYADLPEGEGKASLLMWREFSDTRWAASAGHLFGHPVISSETWTWLHSPAFRATPLDMKAEADLHFLQGINQLVGHGWPYSPPSATEPGWRMYAAAALNAHNPWFFAMPDLSHYLQRVSFGLRQGEPANDVALLLPNDDVWASFKAQLKPQSSPTSTAGFDETGSNVSIDESMDQALGKQVIAQIIDAGFNLDFIDADTIDHVGIPYRALILPDVNRLPVSTYEKIVDFARTGGIVIATRRLPATAPGLMHADQESARIKELSKQLFEADISTAHFLRDEAKLGAELASDTHPDLKLSPLTPEIGFIHRKLPEGNLYFVANTANERKQVRAQFRNTANQAETWDGFSGAISGIPNPRSIELDLAPYESRLIFFADAATAPPLDVKRTETVELDLSPSWKVKFDGMGLSTDMDRLASWSEDSRTKFYSGLATYQKSFHLLHDNLQQGTIFLLDFGEGSKERLPSPPGEHNMKAYFEGPIREAAQIYVNEKLAGVVWRPPFRLDVTGYLREGENELRIVVGNTAINSLAGQSLPDYRLLWQRYGKLFTPQDMENLHPLPSGILGPVTLIKSTPQ